MSAATGTGTRSRLLSAAVTVFGRYGVQGSSLQMIADELGVTKAAVYYHFHTKDEIVSAVVDLLREELDPVTASARTRRSRGARIDEALRGFVDLVVRHRTLVRLLTSDPAIMLAARDPAGSRPDWDGPGGLGELLAGPEPDAAALVRTQVVLRGLSIAAAAPEVAGLDDEVLRRELLDSGRRLLGRPGSRS